MTGILLWWNKIKINNTLSISGGVAPYIIQWSGGEVTGNNNEIMDTKTEGSYQVTVTDALGCSESIISKFPHQI